MAFKSYACSQCMAIGLIVHWSLESVSINYLNTLSDMGTYKGCVGVHDHGDTVMII